MKRLPLLGLLLVCVVLVVWLVTREPAVPKAPAAPATSGEPAGVTQTRVEKKERDQSSPVAVLTAVPRPIRRDLSIEGDLKNVRVADVSFCRGQPYHFGARLCVELPQKAHSLRKVSVHKAVTECGQSLLLAGEGNVTLSNNDQRHALMDFRLAMPDRQAEYVTELSG